MNENLERADGLLKSALGKLDPAVLAGPDEVEFAIAAIREARELIAAESTS